MFSSKNILCIRGLSEHDSETEIYSLLSKYGTLIHLDFLNPKDNKGRKSVLAHYQEESQANYARSSLHNQKFGNNYLFVDYYDPYSSSKHRYSNPINPVNPLYIMQNQSYQLKNEVNQTKTLSPSFQNEQEPLGSTMPSSFNTLQYLNGDKKEYKVIQRGNRGLKPEDNPSQEKKIFKFTEMDKDKKNEKTMLYTKKNLEKIMNNPRLQQTNSGLEKSYTSLDKPYEKKLIDDGFYANNCLPMIQNNKPGSSLTQNYYINGTMNNQQNVYLKSQINFIHFLPSYVNHPSSTIEQIKQSYLENEKISGLDEGIKPLISNNLINPSNIINKSTNTNRLNYNTNYLYNANKLETGRVNEKGLINDANLSSALNEKHQISATKTVIEEVIKPTSNEIKEDPYYYLNKESIKVKDAFKEILKVCDLKLEFEEIEKISDDKKKLRRLYHKFLHKFLQAGHNKMSHEKNVSEKEANDINPKHVSHKLYSFHEDYCKSSHKSYSRSGSYKNFPKKRGYFNKRNQYSPNVTSPQSKVALLNDETVVVEKNDMNMNNGEANMNMNMNIKDSIDKEKLAKTFELNKSVDLNKLKEESTEQINDAIEIECKKEHIEAETQQSLSNMGKASNEEGDIVNENLNNIDILKEIASKKENKKLKNLLNFMMNGGDVTNLKASLMKKRGIKEN